VKRILRIIFFLLIVIPFSGLEAQEAVLEGIIRDSLGKPLEAVSVSVLDQSGGVTSDRYGRYTIRLTPYRDLVIVYSFIGFGTEKFSIRLEPGEIRQHDIVLKSTSTSLGTISIQGEQARDQSSIRIQPKTIEMLPSVSGNFEAVLKTMPGVVSNNELSSTYSVRGGNFDENLVYVNDMEVYRPFLTRSGQQEGLSFINSDMVSDIHFSAGGFNAKYGDKLSSVLDIRYRTPTRFGGSAYFSLLGAGLNLEGVSKNRKFTWITGFRQKSNQFLLNKLDTRGEYKPSFTDFQGLFTYALTKKTEVAILGNFSQNKYTVFPSTRSTEFGNINEALRFTVYFGGSEQDWYQTSQGALSFTTRLNDKLKLKHTASVFFTREQEFYDVLGEYFLDELERDLGSGDFGDVAFNRGVGAFLEHARNELNATVSSAEHRGYYVTEKSSLQWGVKVQHEEIRDELDEWVYRDSADFSIPHPDDNPGDTTNSYYNQQIVLNNVVKNEISLSSNRMHGFLQNTWTFDRTSFTAGIRATYWDLNEEVNISPRISFSWKPEWNSRLVFRAATGFYYQPPFYREMRDLNGHINKELKAQKSIHFVLGADYQFLAWGREFKLVSEAYYKLMDDLIPYKVDNTRLRYLAKNNASGYATGLDFRLNGEFVSGIESWASLSVMQTREDIEGDYYYEYYNSEGERIYAGYTLNDIPVDSNRIEPGNIPRPTDQRVTFSMFFQDYLPKFPSYRMHMTLVFGTGLPFGPPGTDRYKDVLRSSSYRRLDIGFSKILIDEDKENKSRLPVVRKFNSLWASLEIFNLLQISNTVSYTWITDVSGRQYGVPNYLTSRLINLRIQARF
jgi:hypothetical protein